jgi:hypothetical protein
MIIEQALAIGRGAELAASYVRLAGRGRIEETNLRSVLRLRLSRAVQVPCPIGSCSRPLSRTISGRAHCWRFPELARIVGEAQEREAQDERRFDDLAANALGQSEQPLDRAAWRGDPEPPGGNRRATECLRSYKTKAEAKDMFRNACHMTCPGISRNQVRFDLAISWPASDLFRIYLRQCLSPYSLRTSAICANETWSPSLTVS